MKNEIYNNNAINFIQNQKIDPTQQSKDEQDSDGNLYTDYKNIYLQLKNAYASLENDYKKLEEKAYDYQNQIYSLQVENEEYKKILETKKSNESLETNLENQTIYPKENQLNDMDMNDTNKDEVIDENNKKIINLEKENKELLNKLKQEKKEKEKLISEKKDLENKNNELLFENKNLKNILKNNEKKINEYTHKTSELNEKINELKSMLKDKKEMDNLNDEKEKDLNNNNKENEINDNPENNDNEKEYSFECTNVVSISKGTDEVNIEINLRNNGNKTWANDSKLLLDPISTLKGDDIDLNPQNPYEEKSYSVKIKDLKDFPEGEYKAIFRFYSGGYILGEKITTIIKIIEKNDINKKIIDNFNIIKKFREEFCLEEGGYSDEKLLEILKENDFNYENAFSSLFN